MNLKDTIKILKKLLDQVSHYYETDGESEESDVKALKAAITILENLQVYDLWNIKKVM